MKRTRTWWTIKFLKYYEAVNSEYSLSPGDMCCLSHHHHRPKLKAPLLHYPSRRKTKKFWLKESVIQARCCVQWFSFHSAVSCRRHLSVFDWNITERRLLGARFSQISLESLFLLLRSLLLLCYVMHVSTYQTTCFDLCIGHALVGAPKTIIVIQSRSHYEMRRGSWRNLDLEMEIYYSSPSS